MGGTKIATFVPLTPAPTLVQSMSNTCCFISILMSCCNKQAKNRQMIFASVTDFQVVKLLKDAYERVRSLLKKVCAIKSSSWHYSNILLSYGLHCKTCQHTFCVYVYYSVLPSFFLIKTFYFHFFSLIIGGRFFQKYNKEINESR